MDFKKSRMFIIKLIALSILLFICFLQYKKIEKVAKVVHKFSDENRNLIPFFHFIKDYEKEIENSKIKMKADLLNIISFVKGHTTNIQEVEKSLKNVKKDPNITHILKYELFKFTVFFEYLLKNMICGENLGEISHQNMKEKKTLDLFNRFGFYFTDPSGKYIRYFSCLNDLNDYSLFFKKHVNRISVDLSKYESCECKKYPPNIFLILNDILFNLSLNGLIHISYKNFPDLEINLRDCLVFYQPSEFIFLINKENEQIFCRKSRGGYDFYDSNGIIKKFDSNKRLTPVAIKYIKKLQK